MRTPAILRQWARGISKGRAATSWPGRVGREHPSRRATKSPLSAPIKGWLKGCVDVLRHPARRKTSLPGHRTAQSRPVAGEIKPVRRRSCCINRFGWPAAMIAAYVLAVPATAQNPQAPRGTQGGGSFIAYPQRPITDPAAVARGKLLFEVNCSFCHGADARGGDGITRHRLTIRMTGILRRRRFGIQTRTFTLAAL